MNNVFGLVVFFGCGFILFFISMERFELCICRVNFFERLGLFEWDDEEK